MARKVKEKVIEEVAEAEEVAEESTIPMEDLIALGEEMNTIMFPDDRVDFDAVVEEGGEAGLIAQLTADAANIDPKDPFTDGAKATLAAIGVEIEWVEKKAPVKKGKKEKPAKPEKPAKAPKAEKPAKAPKVEKEKKARAEKDGGIGGLVHSILTESKKSWLRTDEDILQEVKTKFPDGNTNLQNIIWYRYQLKNKGLIPEK